MEIPITASGDQRGREARIASDSGCTSPRTGVLVGGEALKRTSDPRSRVKEGRFAGPTLPASQSTAGSLPGKEGILAETVPPEQIVQAVKHVTEDRPALKPQ